jgi:very-short-patch-repair endonuclease
MILTDKGDGNYIVDFYCKDLQLAPVDGITRRRKTILKDNERQNGWKCPVSFCVLMRTYINK